MESNLLGQKTFFQSLVKGQIIKSYFNPLKKFEVTGEERVNSKNQLEKKVVWGIVNKKEFWIAEIDCCSNGTNVTLLL